jgi:hypothetical protein
MIYLMILVYKKIAPVTQYSLVYSYHFLNLYLFFFLCLIKCILSPLVNFFLLNIILINFFFFHYLNVFQFITFTFFYIEFHLLNIFFFIMTVIINVMYQILFQEPSYFNRM